MTKNMTKAQMAEMIARMSAEIEALKAEKATASVVPASTKQTATKGKTSAKSKAETTSAPEKHVVLPVRKGKAVGFDGWLNNKVYRFNKPTADALGGVYDFKTRSILFPTAKAATEYCDNFVSTLTDTQYAEVKKTIDDGFKARATARSEKAAASEAKTSTKSAKKSGLIAKTAKAKKGASIEPVKKPEWRERAEKGEKPFANYSTYKEYWHATIGK